MVNFNINNVNDVAYIIQSKSLLPGIYKMMISKADKDSVDILLNHLLSVRATQVFDISKFVCELPDNDPIKKLVQNAMDAELDKLIGVE